MSAGDGKMEIHLRGALEPLVVLEPMQATQMNMSAALRNNMLFFGVHDEEGRDVMIAIPQIQFMRAISEDDE